MKLIDTTALSEMTGVPARTIDQWAYRKIGPPFIKVGRHRRYRLADVELWLSQHTVETER